MLAATLLGEAAVASGLHAAGSSSYGSQARGGAATSDLIISRDVIDYPHISRPEFLVALSQEGYGESCGKMAEGGVIFYDGFFVKPMDLPGVTQVPVRATETVLDKLGAGQGANVFMLGIVVETAGVVKDEAVFKAVESNLDARFHDVSKKAYRMGRELAAALG